MRIVQVKGVRSTAKAPRRNPFGICLHTTGSGVTKMAGARKEKPIDVALRVYIGMQNGAEGYLWGGPSYVIDHDGVVYQIAPDWVQTAHAGSSNRPAYLNGAWKSRISQTALRHWSGQWGNLYSNPYGLFPSKSPNTDYVGIEMIPVGNGFGTPAKPDLLFTEAQHVNVAKLCREIGDNNKFPSGWETTSRLVGHEDIAPIERSQKAGGWDPGYLRDKPHFDFPRVRALIGQPETIRTKDGK